MQKLYISIKHSRREDRVRDVQPECPVDVSWRLKCDVAAHLLEQRQIRGELWRSRRY
jgi:hypothetical protein